MDISQSRDNLWDMYGLQGDLRGDPWSIGAPPNEPREYYSIMAMDDPPDEPENKHKNSLGQRKRKAEDVEDHDTAVDISRPHKHLRPGPFDAAARFLIPPTAPQGRPDIPESNLTHSSQHGKSMYEPYVWNPFTIDGSAPPPAPYRHHFSGPSSMATCYPVPSTADQDGPGVGKSLFTHPSQFEQSLVEPFPRNLTMGPPPPPLPDQPASDPRAAQSPRLENTLTETSFWHACRQRCTLKAINYKTLDQYKQAFVDTMDEHQRRGTQCIQHTQQAFIAGARSRYPRWPEALEQKYGGSIPPTLASVLDDLTTYAQGPRLERVHALEDAFTPPAPYTSGEMPVVSQARIDQMRKRTQAELRKCRPRAKEERSQSGKKNPLDRTP